MTKIDRLKKILKQRNDGNYENRGHQPTWVVDHIQSILGGIEYGVFGNNDIQRKSLKKVDKKLKK